MRAIYFAHFKAVDK